jgi:hypothetical protein
MPPPTPLTTLTKFITFESTIYTIFTTVWDRPTPTLLQHHQPFFPPQVAATLFGDQSPAGRTPITWCATPSRLVSQ